MGNLIIETRLQCPTTVSRRLVLNDNGFIFDPVTGHSSTVNRAGLAILRQLRESSDVTRVVSALQHEFDVAAAIAERDVIEFSTLLCNLFK